MDEKSEPVFVNVFRSPGINSARLDSCMGSLKVLQLQALVTDLHFPVPQLK
jgi:hypothetical protein